MLDACVTQGDNELEETQGPCETTVVRKEVTTRITLRKTEHMRTRVPLPPRAGKLNPRHEHADPPRRRRTCCRRPPVGIRSPDWPVPRRSSTEPGRGASDCAVAAATVLLRRPRGAAKMWRRHGCELGWPQPSRCESWPCGIAGPLQPGAGRRPVQSAQSYGGSNSVWLRRGATDKCSGAHGR